MKIRTKIISLLALLFVVLIVLEIAVQQQVLMPSFAELERDDAIDGIMARRNHDDADLGLPAQFAQQR